MTRSSIRLARSAFGAIALGLEKFARKHAAVFPAAVEQAQRIRHLAAGGSGIGTERLPRPQPHAGVFIARQRRPFGDGELAGPKTRQRRGSQLLRALVARIEQAQQRGAVDLVRRQL